MGVKNTAQDFKTWLSRDVTFGKPLSLSVPPFLHL